MSLMSTAASGLQSQMNRLDAISNNIANLDTTGYQTTDVTFADKLSQVYGQSPAISGLPDHLTPTGAILGTGVYALPDQRYFSQGAYSQTGQPLDMAIQGDGFFQVSQPNGQTGFTRAGNFGASVNPQNGRFYLATQTGQFVLDVNGKPIDLTGVQLSSVHVSTDGTLTGQSLAGQPTRIGKLGLAYVNNPTSSLYDMGADIYELNPGYRAVTNAKAGTLGAQLMGLVSGGMLEMSNVNLTSQMSKMVETQQNFQMSSQAFNIADKMLNVAIQIR